MEYGSLQEKTRTRLVREGGCVVLRIEARWWEQAVTEGTDVFSSTYRQAAEAFLTWAEQTIGNMAREEYRRAGRGVSHRFRRYGCRYDVEARWETPEAACLMITVTATLERAGHSSPLATEIRRMVWHVNHPHGTPTAMRLARRRFFGKNLVKKDAKSFKNMRKTIAKKERV